ncbi:hypothetical protein BGY98DRAFT_685551 [Russula aff. rugulosa BPL654]|nr:hypothetical protein BGY98DRAFT_685551 [Russula aff. rugulosa BPL654]
MRRYKIVTCILLILSVFGFVLAAPVAVQEVCEACADAVGRGNNMIIGSRERGEVPVADVPEAEVTVPEAELPEAELPEAEVPEDREPLLGQEQEPSSSSSWWSTPSQHQGPSSAPNFASSTDPNPSFSSDESKPLSTSGGYELSSEGEAELIQPGTSTEIQPLPSQPPPTAEEDMPGPNPKNKNIFKTIFSKLRKLKFWPRISGTTSGVGVVTEG